MERHPRSRQQPRRLRRGGPDFEGDVVLERGRRRPQAHDRREPEVGFNWHNGDFQSVTVTFPKVYLGQPAR